MICERRIVQENVTKRYGRGVVPIEEATVPGRFGSPWEGLLEDDQRLGIDRGFFGLSVTEMIRTEQQVRMVLSCAWQTVEHAGWDFHALRNSRTGAQVPGVAKWRHMYGPNEHTVSGTSLSMLANKISHHFNLMGSSITFCTACLSGLTAFHGAIISLQNGDCDQALVGAVNALTSPIISGSFNIMRVISPDGKCSSFDARANGYMRSEGGFIFAIKPLETAERDGDPIYAVIKANFSQCRGVRPTMRLVWHPVAT